MQQVQAQEMAADDDIPPEDPVQFRVVDLRKMVVREVKKDGKKQKKKQTRQTVHFSQMQTILGVMYLKGYAICLF